MPPAYRTRIQDLLLTALVEALAPWTGERRAWLDLEGHGREERFADLDLSRTVGWFTTIYPVVLDLRGIEEPGGVHPGGQGAAARRAGPGHRLRSCCATWAAASRCASRWAGCRAAR